MKSKIIVFDMDDTLYDEITYVKSAFKHLSKVFANQYTLNEKSFYLKLIQVLEEQGRGTVFDEVLNEFNIYSKINVKKALSLYRSHIPQISLRDDAKEILEYFRKNKYPLYLVTDGNKIVQKKKVEALKLNHIMNKVFITHNYGKKYSKPSSYCFEKIAKIENESFENIVYIGDNINKDFINIKALGFKTIRLKNGMFKDIKKDKQYHANVDIDSLLELKELIERIPNENR